MSRIEAFWSILPDDLLDHLQSRRTGLKGSEAAERLRDNTPLRTKKESGTIPLLLNQFNSPIILILLFAAVLSFFLSDATDALIIFIIILISGFLGFWQERRATNAVAKLLKLVQIKADVLRDGTQVEVPAEDVVPGDIVVLSAGDSIPGDCVVLESKDLFVDESTLTGESYPAAKNPGIVGVDAPVSKRVNALFMGTHVVNGKATALVVNTGRQTEFGKISEHLETREQTEFEKGVKKFGYLLMKITIAMILVIFTINFFMQKNLLQSFIFALALAVGLTPQLLPTIISINLAHGARYMAKHKVIVKRLASIENFGNMNILCCDKTGTLTEGVVQVDSAIDVNGEDSEKVLLYAYINASYETGFRNPIDHAIRNHREFDIAGYRKLDEIPYDFERKRLSILVEKNGEKLLITKGSVKSILSACTKVEVDGVLDDISLFSVNIMKRYEDLSSRGFRILAVACRKINTLSVDVENESEMTFIGFIILFDPPKKGVIHAIGDLERMGIKLKIITGDNPLVTCDLIKQAGVKNPKVLTGKEIQEMDDDELAEKANKTDVFAEVEPRQKERVIRALRRTNVVGYMGDGINDAPALHAADVGISVDDGVDVAKGAADIVLLEKDLNVLVQGVRQGRRTFANTMKYIFISTSANFGNMFSMAGLSLFLPFLPLLPKQILFTNLMTDVPEMTIATDSVDREMLEKPQKWDIQSIGNFMIMFGMLSSIFDYITFGVLFFVLGSHVEIFRTGWVIESILSAACIVLIIRSRRPFFKSKPGKYLVAATAFACLTAIAITYSFINYIFGFGPPPISVIAVVLLIVLFYAVLAEAMKHIFYNSVKP
jgi:P-type Mg2+ transporter